MKMFCITLDNNHYQKIKNFGYFPVGLGPKIKNENFLRDNTGHNITKKNPYYGEYSFHFWLWKNNSLDLKNDWIGFCQYRKFWVLNEKNDSINNLKQLSQNLIKDIPNDYVNYESILGNAFYVNEFKLSKFLKRNLRKMIKKPSLFFDSKKRNIKFHFDMMHGEGNLDKAINLLNNKDRNDFKDYVNSEVSFSPHNMFICKSENILRNYYDSVFPWLERCEKEFGFNLSGYGLQRIYGFLAERYLSYWFRKYTKFSTLPIKFADISHLD